MKDLILVLKGMMIGASTIIPGASGGTMAIILGVYDKLIHAVSSFSKAKRKNFLFLIKIGGGGILGMLLLSRVISRALAIFYFPVIFLFLGIVCGGIPVLLQKAKSAVSRKRDYVFSLIGMAIALSMLFQPPQIISLAYDNGFLSRLFLCGVGFFVSIAFVLPGISSSFMLMTLGMYETLFLDAIAKFDAAFLLPFFTGIIAGTICMAKILDKILSVYPRKTYLLILGFIAGSIIMEITKQIKSTRWPPPGVELAFSVAALFIGFSMIQIVIHITAKEKNVKDKTAIKLSESVKEL